MELQLRDKVKYDGAIGTIVGLDCITPDMSYNNGWHCIEFEDEFIIGISTTTWNLETAGVAFFMNTFNKDIILEDDKFYAFLPEEKLQKV